MKIACIASTDVHAPRRASGHSRALAHARALGDAGHQVTLFGVLSPGTEPESDHGPIVIVRAAVEADPERPLQASGAWRNARAKGKFQPVIDALLARSRPDVVHAFGVDIAVAASAAARRVGATFVFDDTGESRADAYARSVNELPQGARRRLLRRVVGMMQRRVDRAHRRIRAASPTLMVASTPQLAANVMERYGGPEPLVVRDCFPTARRADPHDLRVRLGTFPGERLVVFRGDDGPGSGAEAAVRALRILGPGHVLVFVGLERPSAAIESLAKECGVTSRLRYLAACRSNPSQPTNPPSQSSSITVDSAQERRPPHLPGSMLLRQGLHPSSTTDDAPGRTRSSTDYSDRLLASVPERELIAMLASADVALLPGEPVDRCARLGLPWPLFEFLAAGVPIAASALPAVGALIRDTGAGVLYSARRPTDPGALAEAIRTILGDPSLAAICRDRALSVARSELSWSRESQQFVTAYDLSVCTDAR